MGRISKFGPAVIGEKQFKAEQAVRANPVQKFGPAVLGEPEPPQAPEPPAPTEEPTEPTATGAPAGEGEAVGTEAEPINVEAIPGFSVEDVREALADNPALVDQFLAAERERKPAPRKGVLHALVQAEEKRPGGKREDVINELVKLLTPEA